MTSSLEATLQKLRGQLVATPLIGDARLPGFDTPPGLRIKAENLQVGGGVWFRGAMHELAQHLGAIKGVVLTGSPREVVCGAFAARLQRLDARAVVADERVDATTRAMLESVGCAFECVRRRHALDRAESLARELGFARLGGLASDAFRRGVATLGLELAAELPLDTAAVFVAPSALAEPVAAGLEAGGRACVVTGVDGRADADLAAAVRTGLRIESDLDSLVALRAAIETDAGADPCVVLAS